MQQLESNKKITAGIATPAWPMRHFPNGIVTYVNNVVSGFDSTVKPIVLAGCLIDTETNSQLIDFSNFSKDKTSLQLLTDRLLWKINNNYTKSILYKKGLVINAKKIAAAIHQLDNPLDIFELEETFGTAVYLKNMIKVPIVTRIHGPWFTMKSILNLEENKDYALRVFYEGEAMKRVPGLTSPSLDALNQVREYYGWDLPHAKVIPNPVCEVSADKQWHYVDNAAPSILFVGRFDLHKGGDLMLDAFHYLATKNKDIKLIFVGPDLEVVKGGVAYKIENYMQQFIRDEAISQRIQFLGHCDQSRISELRKNAHVTVVSSRYETFSIALVEALSAGCPVVATAVGGIKEIIVDGYNGFLATPESAEDIADKVLALINDPDKMQSFSRNAIEDCKKRFSPEVVAAQTADYYRSVLEGS